MARWIMMGAAWRFPCPVVEVEALGQVEVELHGGALPLAADGVEDLDVDLGAVEGAAALVHLVVPPLSSERLLRAPSALSQISGPPTDFSGLVERFTSKSVNPKVERISSVRSRTPLISPAI